MIATLLLLCAQAPAQLTPELLVNHPGFVEGRYSDVREDQLLALEADPTSRWAYPAVRSIHGLDSYCAEPIKPERLAKLADSVTNARAQLTIQQMLEAEIHRRRFSDTPYPSADDLHSDFFDNWFVLGPYGRLDEPAPLWGDSDQQAPHHQLLPEFRSAAGTPLAWKPVTRPHNAVGVNPDRELYPLSGGTAYLLASVEADVEEALLEVASQGAVQIYWNGKLVHEELRVGLTHADARMTVPVRLAPGPNQLLLRFEHGQGSIRGARLLALDDRVLASPATTSTSLQTALRECPATDSAGLEAILPPDSSGKPFAVAVDMLVAISNNRADKALAVPEPSSPEELPAWLRLRHLALRTSEHLPSEVYRRFQLEVEDRLEGLGLSIPEIDAHRAQRFMEENQVGDALTLAEQLVEAYPQVPMFHWIRNDVLNALDNSGISSRQAIRKTLEVIEDAQSWGALADEALERNDVAAAIELLTRAVALNGGTEGYAGQLLGLLAEGTESELRRAEKMLERWRADEPYSHWFDDWSLAIHRQRNDREAVGALLERRVRERADLPRNWQLLGSYYLRNGENTKAREALERALEIRSDDEWARQALEQLGEVDDSEEFFREFAADREAAIAAGQDASGASTALILDSRLVYLRENGSGHGRTHSITLALDRTGTELLQQQGELGETRVAQVLGVEGLVFEPILVEGSWVMPSLDPGDAVELVYDDYPPATQGGAPSISMWSFESFDQPFLISRLVVYLPDGLPGRWDMDSFTGSHEEIPWKNGVVHVFEMRDRPRLEPENAAPSARELVSWVEYGEDIETHFAAQAIESNLAWQQDVAEDVAVPLRELVAEVAAKHSRDELPRALFDAVTDHVIEFSGGGDTTDVWYLRRGNPTGLLAALFEIAEIPFEWAVPFPDNPRELDPDPERPFLSGNDLGQPWFRIENSAGEVTWLFVPQGARGNAYGRIPARAGGTRLLVLGDSGWRFETLPPAPEDAWISDLEVDIYLQEDKSARASLRFLLSDFAGPLTRETISQLEPQQREQALRQAASRMVKGIDVGQWEVKDMRVRGEDFELLVEGTIERFVLGSSKKPYCKLPWEPLRLSRAAGEGERRWPFVIRDHQAVRSTLRIHGSENWGFGTPPESKQLDREGIHYEIRFEPDADMLTALKKYRVHGLVLEAAELADFARELKDLEDLDSARIPLTAKK